MRSIPTPSSNIASQDREEGRAGWDHLQARLRQARAALEHGLTTSSERNTEILKQRAREIAEAPEVERATHDNLDLLEFRLAQETYAVERRIVVGTMPLREYAVLPLAPSLLVGVCLFRGSMLSVFDLRRVFALPPAGLTNLNRVVVLSAGVTQIGILADELEGVTSIRLDCLSPPLPARSGRDNYVLGVSPAGMIVLDTRVLLAENSPLLELSRSDTRATDR